MATSNPVIIKIILLGNSGVGKTSVIKRFENGIFDQHEPTIENGQATLNISLSGMKIIIRILDTVGQEKFNSIPDSFYRKTHGVIVVYDVSDLESYLGLTNWLKRIQDYCPEAAVLVAGNKSDKLTGDKCVNVRTIERLAELENYTYIETSAMSGANITEAFQEMLRLILLQTNSIAEGEKLEMKVLKRLTTIELDELDLQEEDENKKRMFKRNLDKLILKQIDDEGKVDITSASTSTQTQSRGCPC